MKKRAVSMLLTAVMAVTGMAATTATRSTCRRRRRKGY